MSTHTVKVTELIKTSFSLEGNWEDNMYEQRHDSQFHTKCYYIYKNILHSDIWMFS